MGISGRPRTNPPRGSSVSLTPATDRYDHFPPFFSELPGQSEQAGAESDDCEN